MAGACAKSFNRRAPLLLSLQSGVSDALTTGLPGSGRLGGVRRVSLTRVIEFTLAAFLDFVARILIVATSTGNWFTVTLVVPVASVSSLFALQPIFAYCAGKCDIAMEYPRIYYYAARCHGLAVSGRKPIPRSLDARTTP